MPVDLMPALLNLVDGCFSVAVRKLRISGPSMCCTEIHTKLVTNEFQGNFKSYGNALEVNELL